VSSAACAMGAREAHLAPVHGAIHLPSRFGVPDYHPRYAPAAYALGWQSVAMGCPLTCT